MLGSLNSSSSSPHEQDQQEEATAVLDLQFQQIINPQATAAAAATRAAATTTSTTSVGGFTSSAIYMRQLLISCAELISQSDFSAAHRLISVLSSSSSPYGDSRERSAGFNNVPLSPYALSQAKLLLRLHYPSEGYHLQMINDSFFLGWQNRALFSVSSWH
ncbi:hypothetical protein RCOM_0364340 [Ricinus communis]|uniref:Uncharacterized protein n=1 Tax=Ricinus communis TaxID=3988 RepID=B9ST94_RICCO|nr:hypothetical protein RCOM_0364340 [Ricinus communis]